jgi:hypothetical protein
MATVVTSTNTTTAKSSKASIGICIAHLSESSQ